MAIFDFGPIVSGARGSVGGVTFSANKSGPFFKSKGLPSNPQSQPQMVQRAFFASVATEWRALSGAQKSAWDVFAALKAQELFNSLGLSYYASGFNWFLKCNSRLDRLARAHISAVPTQARPSAPSIHVFRVTVAGANPNLCVGGSATASTTNPGDPASAAFDGDTGSGSQWQTLAPNSTGWLEYQFLASEVIREYTLYPYTFQYSRNPADWTFEYWDGGAWQIVDTVSGESWSSPGPRTFPFDNDVSSSRWRINVSANQGFATILAITELEMYAADAGASCIHYPSNEFVASPDYDLVLHISTVNSVGPQVRYPNYFEILATQSPGVNSTGFQVELSDVFGTISAGTSWFCKFYRQTSEGIRSAPATARTEILS